MKILMTADPIGGVWAYALELCAALRNHGAEVILATLGAPLSRAQRSEALTLSNLALYESGYRLEWMTEPWDSLAEAGDWLLELERRVEPDVVHLNHLVHGDLPWRAPALVTAHSCVLSWWNAVHRVAAPPEWDRYRHRVTRSLRAAQRVVAPTRTLLISLHNLYGPFRASTAIHNARNPQRFYAATKEPLILSAGRLWDEAKNMAAVSKAAPDVHWPICVAGASLAPGVEHTLKGVRAVGPLTSEQLADWYARASIYVLPARYEPFGLTVLEAAMSGCALVLGDIASLRELWDDCAVYVPPDDAVALRETLNELIVDTARRCELARRALDRSANYSLAEFAAGYWQVYQSLFAVTKEPEACDSYCSITP